MTTNDEPRDVLKRPFERYSEEVLRRVWDRMHVEDQHNMIALIGEEGSGKSETSLKLADLVDKTFRENVTDRVLFDIAEFLEVLQNGDHSPGDAYVLDEAGVSLGNRTWQDRSQVLANQALQLVRSHNLTLFFTLPRLDELDSQAVARLQAFYEIKEKEQGEYVEGAWLYLDPDRTRNSGKVFRKYPRVMRDGQQICVQSLRFGPPDDELTEKYTPLKNEHQKKVYQETLNKLKDSSDGGGSSVDYNAKQICEDIIAGDGVEEYIREYNNGTQKAIDKDLIAAEYEVGRAKAKRAKKLIMKKVDV